MEIRWTPSALRDIDAAADFLRRHNPSAARRMARRIQEAAEVLVVYPASGRTGRLSGTRELVASGTPFVIVYRVRLDAVQVLRLLHHARRWP